MVILETIRVSQIQEFNQKKLNGTITFKVNDILCHNYHYNHNHSSAASPASPAGTTLGKMILKASNNF